MNILSSVLHRKVLAGMTLGCALLTLGLDLPQAFAQAYGQNAAQDKAAANSQRPPRPGDGEPPREGREPHRIDFVKELGVDAKTAQALQQVLRQQHEKRMALRAERDVARARHEALRAETDQKLGKLLTAAQLEKLRKLMPRPPQPPGPPPEARK